MRKQRVPRVTCLQPLHVSLHRLLVHRAQQLEKTHDPRHDLYTTPNLITVFSLSMAMAVIRDANPASQESLEIKYDRPIIHLG